MRIVSVKSSVLGGCALVLCLAIGPVRADTGLILKESAFEPAETLDRLESVVKKKGLTIFARIDHAAGAKKAGASLRPTQLLLFGNPKMGTPLMNTSQTIGLDLPMKVLAWQDERGQNWIAYNKPEFLATRHDIEDQEEIIAKMTGALDKLTDKASKPDS